MADQKWKRWGAELRHHRRASGTTQTALAKAVHLAGPTLSAFERGTRTPRREHAVIADEVLATGGALSQLWDELHDEREIPEEWKDYAKVEQRAVEIREYQLALFPGLLQTPEYTRTVLRNAGLWDTNQTERLVASRSSRLDGIGQTKLTFVLDEIVIRKVVGTRDVLCQQLDAVLKLVCEGRAGVLVVPEYSPLHPNPTSPFRVMTLGDGRLVAHEEYWTGINVTTGSRVNQFVSLFGNLQSEALNLHSSIELIEKVRKEL